MYALWCFAVGLALSLTARGAAQNPLPAGAAPASSAAAPWVSTSRVHMTHGGATVELMLPMSQLFPSAMADVGALTVATESVADIFSLRSGEGPCRRISAGVSQMFRDSQGAPWLSLTTQLACPDDAPRTLALAHHPLLSSGAQHLVRIDPVSGPLSDHLLSGSARTITLARASYAHGELSDHVRYGMKAPWLDPRLLALLCGLLLMNRRKANYVGSFLLFVLSLGAGLYGASAGWLSPTAALRALLGFAIAFPAVACVYADHHGHWAIPLGLFVGCLALLGQPGALSAAASTGLLAFALCHFSLVTRRSGNASGNADRGRYVPFAGPLTALCGLLYGLSAGQDVADWHYPPADLPDAQVGYWLGLLSSSALAYGALALMEDGMLRLGGPRTAYHLRSGLSAITCGAGIFWLVAAHLS